MFGSLLHHCIVVPLRGWAQPQIIIQVSAGCLECWFFTTGDWALAVRVPQLWIFLPEGLRLLRIFDINTKNLLNKVLVFFSKLRHTVLFPAYLICFGIFIYIFLLFICIHPSLHPFVLKSYFNYERQEALCIESLIVPYDIFIIFNILKQMKSLDIDARVIKRDFKILTSQ